MSSETEKYRSAFDKALPTHIKALYIALKSVHSKGDALVTSTHECNCEYCDVSEDRELPYGNAAEYRELREESLEIAETIKRCLRWADFKGIEIKDRDSIHIQLFTLEEMEPAS